MDAFNELREQTITNLEKAVQHLTLSLQYMKDVTPVFMTTEDLTEACTAATQMHAACGLFLEGVENTLHIPNDKALAARTTVAEVQEMAAR